ncbi:hypothetical protein B0H65DRAFT_444464 [Neurospora tetraspora]|uniref:Uncharacterized protein n=1 Tax=Neurospora tetraspora TaxID=94610 RepID=A0AAE0MPS6_9PEZI|nr:hypothetical protein B0H65DRAFT_444464 [Neurospora tetraspora]
MAQRAVLCPMGDYVPMTLGRRAYVVAALQTVLRMERSPANKCIMDNMRAKYKAPQVGTTRTEASGGRRYSAIPMYELRRKGALPSLAPKISGTGHSDLSATAEMDCIEVD